MVYLAINENGRMTSRGLGECPICHQMFNIQRLPVHINMCLDQQQEEPQVNELPVVVVKPKRKDSGSPAPQRDGTARFSISVPFSFTTMLYRNGGAGRRPSGACGVGACAIDWHACRFRRRCYSDAAI